MKTRNFAFPVEHLIVMDASGKLDLAASKDALRKVASDPAFDDRTEVLLDLRDVDCELSTLDLYELASHMAWPDPALPTRRKVAVLVEGREEFDHARFLEMCLRPGGMAIAAFDDYDEANDWLSAELPEDPKKAA